MERTFKKVRFRLVKAHQKTEIGKRLSLFFMSNGKYNEPIGFARGAKATKPSEGPLWGVGDTRWGHQKRQANMPVFFFGMYPLDNRL